MSVEELAERSGLSVRGLLSIEHGRRNPSVPTLLAMAEISVCRQGRCSMLRLRLRLSRLRGETGRGHGMTVVFPLNPEGEDDWTGGIVPPVEEQGGRR